MKSSHQKHTEKQLASIKSTFEKNNKLSYDVFQQMPIGICITNPNGYFTDVNATYCDIYGYTRDELIGAPFTTIVPESEHEVLKRLHDEFIKDGYELQGKWMVQNKQKQKFEIITNAALLTDAETGERRKMTLVVKAIELELTIDRLKTTIAILENKIKTQDIANRLAEHDMRNSIGSMVSIADILSKTKLDDTQRLWVRRIKDIGNDTLRLLTSAKDFAQMERGDYTPDIKTFDLVSLIASTTRDLKDLIDEREGGFQMYINGNPCEPGEDELFMKGDKFYLHHLFQNLMRNALEASAKNKTVDIYIDQDPLFIIKINNDGVIPEGIRGSFFDKYSSSGKERGTGLGTYISKMIAEMHDGTLTFVTSEKDGTSLVLKLPENILVRA